MTFVAWPEIEALYNIKKFIRIDPTDWWRGVELLSGTSTVKYRAKIKLHGTNSAIQLHKDGTVLSQSRTQIISPTNDNAGFAKWVESNKEIWQQIALSLPEDMIIWGEWAGQSIQKGVAISDIGKKVFAIFAARPLKENDDRLIVDPDVLEILFKGCPNTYILPWYSIVESNSDTRIDAQLDINWKATDEDLTKNTTQINEWVMAVEANDPWVSATFGVNGTGEGLVFYPVSETHTGWNNFNNLCFKAKGEKHKNIATAKPAQVNPEAAVSIDAFVSLVLTSARLEQGARTVALTPDSFDSKQTGKFVSWVLKDVEKETQDELAVSNLTFKQVQKAVSDKVRQWYLEQTKK